MQPPKYGSYHLPIGRFEQNSLLQQSVAVLDLNSEKKKKWGGKNWTASLQRQTTISSLLQGIWQYSCSWLPIKDKNSSPAYLRRTINSCVRWGRAFCRALGECI